MCNQRRSQPEVGSIAVYLEFSCVFLIELFAEIWLQAIYTVTLIKQTKKEKKQKGQPPPPQTTTKTKKKTSTKRKTTTKTN